MKAASEVFRLSATHRFVSKVGCTREETLGRESGVYSERTIFGPIWIREIRALRLVVVTGIIQGWTRDLTSSTSLD
jgi:hypothetical protein